MRSLKDCSRRSCFYIAVEPHTSTRICCSLVCEVKHRVRERRLQLKVSFSYLSFQVYFTNTILVYLSSTINPFIYGVMNKAFRRELFSCARKVFCPNVATGPTISREGQEWVRTFCDWNETTDEGKVQFQLVYSFACGHHLAQGWILNFGITIITLSVYLYTCIYSLYMIDFAQSILICKYLYLHTCSYSFLSVIYHINHIHYQLKRNTSQHF